MKIWYNAEVQMLGKCERTEELDAKIESALGFGERDIDEREAHRLTAFFTSDMVPSTMRGNITELLKEHPEIYYIDVTYRWDSENVPDRFVIWKDGRIQEYTGRVIFVEDQ